jgi:hypothetical protein
MRIVVPRPEAHQLRGGIVEASGVSRIRCGWRRMERGAGDSMQVRETSLAGDAGGIVEK